MSFEWHGDTSRFLPSKSSLFALAPISKGRRSMIVAKIVCKCHHFTFDYRRLSPGTPLHARHTLICRNAGPSLQGFLFCPGVTPDSVRTHLLFSCKDDRSPSQTPVNSSFDPGRLFCLSDRCDCSLTLCHLERSSVRRYLHSSFGFNWRNRILYVYKHDVVLLMGHLHNALANLKISNGDEL